ncbi:CWF19-like protein 2 [Vespa crabro]|uniref:CWF19-like protein 2 n=1 Tax=Vespa crabro TaxID=7445 RepID=UPI001EFF6FE8|nr:CWF19-like protein 2 [Vespa crabro]XP_046835526.1 CWF19-like protein 2 [Vespa crabro]
MVSDESSIHKKSDKSLENKKRKHSKKEKKKSKKKKKKKRNTSSSSDSSTGSDNEVWVEKTIETIQSVQNTVTDNIEKEPVKREEWMTLGNLFPCISKSDIQSNKHELQKKDNNISSILDKPGQSNKELNPYWKDGGTGLPRNEPEKSFNKKVMDPVWLKRSLQRAREQALEEGKSLEEIAAERWGSLETINAMIAEADQSCSKYNQKNSQRNRVPYERRYYDKYSNRHRESEQDHSSYRSRNFDREQKYESYRSDRSSRKPNYQKPTDDGDRHYTSALSKSNSHSQRNWQKDNGKSKKQLESNVEIINEEISKKDNKVFDINTQSNDILTKEEMNKLGAKIIKAELMGDNELANHLKEQLEKAREHSNQANKSETENVILSRTDSKGVTRPIQPRCQSKESSTKSKKNKNLETHVSGERIRYYGDDDKYSLQQLFQREKGRSVDDDNAAFVKIASKNVDMNDIFEEQIARVDIDSRQDDRDKAKAIKEHKRISKSLEGCSWCIESKNMIKHMIITMDSHICLSLPTRVSLVIGHCVLTPLQHISCQLQLDEDIWEKMKIFKETLIKMFMDSKQTPIFFEVYKNRHKFPHMQLECVPLSDESADLAPMYFKKALLECETEWAINKKIVDLKNKDLRRAIPNGLPYFMVQFGNNGGYAHVIEDERMFPTNFAEEIIGGILDLDHNLWRKPKRETFEQQREKVLNFKKIWDKYKH